MSDNEINFENILRFLSYSISIQLENNISAWYSDKTIEGFTIKFENTYTGILVWSAIYLAS